MDDWKKAAEYCEVLYGVKVNYEEEFFICPDCGDPIYRSDWEDYSECPICGMEFS